MTYPRSRTALLALRGSLLTALLAHANAQCSTSWLLPGLGIGVGGTIETMATWDPDGNGPQTPLVVLGGMFGQAGATAASNVAFFDPTTWTFTAPTNGPNGRVLAILGLANGDLIVGGEFTQVGPIAGTGGIARWDGAAWHALAGGVGGTVRALLELQNGEVVAAGTFQTAGLGLTVNHVARWDSTAWSSLGQGLQQPIHPLLPAGAETLLVLPSGELLAGGNFTQAGATAARAVARWDGLSWSAFDGGLVTWSRVRQLFRRGNGALHAVGDILGPTTSTNVVEWNGTSWVPPNGFPGDVQLLAETASGQLLAAAGVPFSQPHVLALQGGSWTSIATTTGGFLDGFRAIVPLPGYGPDDLILGGTFTAISGLAAANLALQVAGNWFGSGSGPDAPILAMASAADGTLYVGGRFTSIDGVPLARIAAWDGASWQALGSGVDNRVASLAVAPGGDLYAAGWFQNAGGVPAPSLARWDGAAWHAVPGGPYGTMLVGFLRDGTLLAGGQDLMLHDGTGWQTIATNNNFTDFVELPDGRVAVTGGLSNWNNAPGGPSRTAIWNGTAWQPLQYAHSIATDITVDPNGDIVLAAAFFNGDRIARWDGTSWQPLGAGLDDTAETLVNLPNGQLVAGGTFTMSGPTSVPHLALFDGASWLPLGAASPVLRAHFAPTGRLLVATHQASPRLLQRVTNCPAISLTLPSGCVSGNPITLQASAWPYVGGQYRAHALGLPSGAVAFDVYGVGTNPTLLSAVLPNATPGCTLLPRSDYYALLFSSSGLAPSELILPNASWLAGARLWHQVLSLQIDAQGNLLDAATSNPLELTIGFY